jgi:hypothetical protein
VMRRHTGLTSTARPRLVRGHPGPTTPGARRSRMAIDHLDRAIVARGYAAPAGQGSMGSAGRRITGVGRRASRLVRRVVVLASGLVRSVVVLRVRARPERRRPRIRARPERRRPRIGARPAGGRSGLHRAPIRRRNAEARPRPCRRGQPAGRRARRGDPPEGLLPAWDAEADVTACGTLAPGRASS